MQNSQSDQDRDLSFSIINYLSASYRGKLAGYTLLGQLMHPDFEERELDVIQNNTDRIAEWLNGLTRGEALFTAGWETLETFEAQSAINLLEKLKPDLAATSQNVESFIKDPSSITSDQAKYLFGALTRSSMARDVYLRGFIIFADTFQKPEMRINYGNMLVGASQQNSFVQEGITLFRNSAFNLETLGPSFIASLVGSCLDLASIFRTHIHDINLLACNFKGGPTYTNLGFTQDEANQWQSLGIAGEVAGYWKANGFDASQTADWVKNLVNTPAEAALWQNAGFTPEKAKPWGEIGLPFADAFSWIQAGYIARIAKEHIDKGIYQPPPEES